MRILHILSLTFFLSLIVLTSCETVLDPEDFPHSPKMAVHCLFSPGNPWELTISSSGNILSDDLLPDWVEGAKVSISGDDGSYTDLFEYRGNGLYYCDRHIPVAGVQYALMVSHQDFPGISAKDKIPVEKAAYDLNLNQQFAEGKTWMLLTLTPEKKETFSNLIISNSVRKTYQDVSGQLLVLEETALLLPDDRSIGQFQFDDANKGLRQKLFLKKMTEDSLGILSQGGYRKSTEVNLIEGLSIWHFYFGSDAFFKYHWISSTSGIYPVGTTGTFSLKYDAFTNIHNGYGIFAGYNVENYETTF